ncbi:uncharacterized protein METZ01_LOCUS453513 [marine metagenome]|uniref:Uncharacterized protein n=1 Tax=marine metagenome TaxID=408172 RepID=A0A382ZZA6_9ZZZZ
MLKISEIFSKGAEIFLDLEEINERYLF